MNIFVNHDSVKHTLDRIGQTYDDNEVSMEQMQNGESSVYGNFGGGGGGLASTTGDELSVDTTVSTAEYIRRAGLHQRRKRSPVRQPTAPSTVFSGSPADVVHFRSCIPPQTGAARVRRREADGAGDGAQRGEDAAVPPAQNGPFNEQVLARVLLFLDASSAASIIQFGLTCRMWHYYANLAPHWTYLRRSTWRRRHTDLPKYIRLIVMKPKLVTREEYIAECKKVDECERRERLIGTAKFFQWCIAVAILAGASVTCNYVVAYVLGYLRTALNSDVELGVTAFIMALVMTLLEVVLVINPLSGGSQSTKEVTVRVLCWSMVILTLSLVFCVVTSLAYTRVQSLSHVLNRESVELTMGAPCAAYGGGKKLPSFIFLPALLSDMRWRPLTTSNNTLDHTLRPYCVRSQCFVVLYFDAWYRSDVFQNASALAAGKDVGTRTAFGFDPFTEGRPVGGMWCSASDYPQLIAVTTALYKNVTAERDALYPRDEQWLDPAQRPSGFHSISYRGSSDINRQRTEDPRGSADAWADHAVPWRRLYVPLLTNYRQEREAITAEHDQFLHYAFACYGISGVVWLIMLISQIVLRNAAIYVLGITTVITLIFLNPISMIISGFLCVSISDEYFMCSSTSGGALIGGGFSLSFLFLVIYLSAIE